MSFSAVQVLLTTVGLYLLWRRFTAKSALANIPGPPAESWWKGSFFLLFDAKFHHDIVEKYGSVVKLRMLFGAKELYVSDPLALHHITVKDQYIYEETSMFLTINYLTHGISLLSTLGEHHRRQRKMLNPVFSLKHMRDLLPIFYPIGYELRDVLIEQAGDGTKEVDVMHWTSRAALEYIGRGGLGYSFNALHDAEAAQYGEKVKEIPLLLFKVVFFLHFLPFLTQIGTPAFRRRVLEWMPFKVTRRALELTDNLENKSREIYLEKKTGLEEGDASIQKQVGNGKDIMSILLKANMAAKETDRLPEKELIGQVNTFIVAGQDTTTHAISRILHQLVLHPDVQVRLRDEIAVARKEHGGEDLEYDTLMGLLYLDAVCRETLRVFPPLANVTRTTRQDVIMPLAYPIVATDGKTQVSEIPIKKGTNVIVSIIGANKSKKIWGEDAEEWKPERWLKPLPESVSQAHLPGVYSSMMTFIGGGRACIGFKFAELEMKLVLSVLLETFEFGAGPEVEWVLSGLAKPVLKNSVDKSPRLPLKVSLVRDKA